MSDEWCKVDLNRLPNIVVTPPGPKSRKFHEQTEFISDTGELYRNSKKKIAWIDTQYTKAVYGFLGKAGKIKINGLKLNVKTQFATIALSSLTDEPIEKSTNILLTAVGQANNIDFKYDKDKISPGDIGHGPIMIEVIEATLELKTEQPHLVIYSVNSEGFYIGNIPTEYNNGILKFEIGKVFPSMYYLLQKQ